MESAPDDYKVRLEVFEGPLDLLLYLIKRDEVDIYDIPIEQITRQYMEYLDLMKMLDLNIAGEFLVMAATLMMIKSRMLLPVEDRPELDDDDEDDPRWDLVRQLVEYKKFKDAASHLEEMEEWRDSLFGSGIQPQELEPEIDDAELQLGEVNIFDLLALFNDVLKRARPEEIGEIFAKQYTVADKIDRILHSVKTGPRVSFVALFESAATRHEIAVTFLALLELIKLRQVTARQDQAFGEIYIEAVTE